LPDIPVIVTGTGPIGVAVPEAVSVITLEVVVGLVEKEAVTPLGRPVAERVALNTNPPTSVIVIVLVPLVPCAIDNEPGEADKLKLGGTATVS
jgi:hypothetical protein